MNAFKYIAFAALSGFCLTLPDPGADYRRRRSGTGLPVWRRIQ
jgi:hypothetical protein